MDLCFLSRLRDLDRLDRFRFRLESSGLELELLRRRDFLELLSRGDLDRDLELDLDLRDRFDFLLDLFFRREDLLLDSASESESSELLLSCREWFLRVGVSA